MPSPYALGTKYLRDNFPNYPMDSRGRVAAFGYPHTSPIPKHHQDVTAVGGIILYLYAGHPTRRKHRIFAECPKCRVAVPAGRLHQHVGTCEGM